MEIKSREISDDHLYALSDPILPTQFFEAAGAKTFSSEQRLMLAVLTDAINILAGHRVSPNLDKRDAFNEASSWVFADGTEGPVSFERVCDALGVNAASLRRRLAELLSPQGNAGLFRLRIKEGSRIQRVTGPRRRRGHLARNAHSVLDRAAITRSVLYR